MSAFRGFRRSRGRRLSFGGATLVVAAFCVFFVAASWACITPPITTTATPGGSSNAPGAAQHDYAMVGTTGTPAVGSVKFFLCSPSDVTANGGDCSKNGTQVGSAVTLAANGSGNSATVNGTTTPSDNALGKYCWRSVFTPGANEHHYTAGTHTNSNTECFTIVKASPCVSTKASVSGSGVVGVDSTSDSATVSGGNHPSGSIQFSLKAPDGTTSKIGSPVAVNGAGSYASPSSVLLSEVGTYTWSASYSGDSLNNGAVDNGANESVTSTKASPSISTKASVTGNGVVGVDSTSDSATVSGGDHPSGSIQFSLKAPDGTTSPVGSPVAVNGDGSYASPSSVPLSEVGTYTWSASYSGDSLNNGAVDNGANESVTSSKASPSISTTPDPSSGSVDDVLNDTAHLSGGSAYDGSGSITFDLYGPSDPTCSGTPAYTETVTADHNGDYQTSNSSFQAGTAGTWNWTASFSGDSNNDKAAGDCGDESVVINAASIHIVKTADAAQVNAGEPIGFTLTVYNDGTGTAHGVALSDTLPTKSGLSWKIADTGAGWGSPSSCGIAAGVLSCGPATVPAGTTQEASTFTVHVTSGTDASTGGVCPDGSGVIPNTGNVTSTNGGSDQSTAQTCVAAPAIHIVKTADKAQVDVGEPIGFTLTVSNNGSGDAHGVSLSDTLPTNPGLAWSIDETGVGWGSSCSIASGELTCGPVTVPAGTTQAASTFTVHITSQTRAAAGGDCPETGVVDNTGMVTADNDGSDQSTATTCVQALVDLSVSKTGSPATQELGAGNITWTMVVTNNGPDADSGVKIADPMPAGNTFVSATTTKGSCTGGAILNCTIGDMAAGEQVTITLITTPSTEGDQVNTVNVVGNRPETDTTNNTATAKVQVTAPHTPPTVFCVAVSRVTPKQLYVGRKTKLTIHVTQHGKAAKGVRVRITGPKVDVRTKPSNQKGIIARSVTLKKAGIMIFSPIAGKRCNTQRVGVTNVFTPPVTG